MNSSLMKALLALSTAALAALPAAAQEQPRPKRNWVESTAFVIPKETAPEGEGYFSIVCGHNGRLYIGTHANAANAWLVEFDPKAEKMNVVVDAHKEIGTSVAGFAAQSKIHTRNNVGASGKIYFGTKQGYPAANEKREDYPGGYPMVYDPATGKTKVYPIPVPHHGINSITPDESRGVAYISTCSDHRPGPGENAIFLILDLEKGTYRELMDTEHFYGFIVVDHLGRAYHPIHGGDIARYDPRTDKLERLKQTIDGKPPTDETRLARTTDPDPINWDISPDGKTLYAQPMRGNALYAYDLTAEGDTLPGRTVGTLIPGAKSVDCRALCVGRSGTVWAAITESAPEGVNLLHLASYRPGDAAPVDHGPVSIRNPDYTGFTGPDGKQLPFHGGLYKTPDGKTTTRYVIMGVCEGLDDSVYILALHPYTLLQVPIAQLKR
jgi:sugar lactone lactonase YvrE